LSRLLTKGFFLFSILLISTLTGFFNIIGPSVISVSAQPNVPYILGNWTYVNNTYVNNPVLPVYVNELQIPVGSNWTYIYTLEAESAYRVYCYGDWIDYSTATNKTDYDIFVYDPDGNLQSYHTEAAGLPEHLSTIDGHPFFVPKQTGNYSFLIKNDLKESSGAKAATFMIIEHILPNKWYQLEMEGKVDDEPVEKTTWAYEFNTTSNNFEIWVKVPETLDMYETRIYPMASPSLDLGTILNEVPLAWEPGLYANTSGIYGGYNLDSDGFRISNAIASCEYSGEDMFINFTAPAKGNLLYHLALIAEYGEGTIEFMIKTDFDSPVLNLVEEIKKTSPNNPTPISVYALEESNLEIMVLNYTKDYWETHTAIEMFSNQNATYTATIPGQRAGTIINYTILSRDITGNSAELQSSYSVKNTANITLELANSVVEYGKNITVTGSLPISETNLTLTYVLLNSSLLNGTKLDNSISNNTILNYSQGNSTITRIISPDSKGDFHDQHSLNKTGTWLVWATWNGNEEYFGASSDYRNVTIHKMNTTVTCNLTSNSITIGDNITVLGSVNPKVENLIINISFTTSNSTIEQNTYTDTNGTYSLSWKPDFKGLWQVNAVIDGNASITASYSNVSKFSVNDTFLNQYMLYIIGCIAGVCGVSVIIFIIKRREEE